METNTWSVPCLFGLEGIAADELRRLKLEDVRAENGRVLFSGDLSAMVRANLNLRTGERVLLRLGEFPAETFEELFQGVLALPLEDFIPRDGSFPVKGYCLNSALHSVPDCQKIIKKAAAVRLGQKYGLTRLPETGALYQLQFSLMRDRAEIFLDTSGAGLHKRGYRAVGNDAPLRETLAAAMVLLTRYRGREVFLDPMCGSGTIPIEAAWIARNHAPGMQRSFSAQSWQGVPARLWQEARTEALDREYHGDYRILASDIDEKSVTIAQSNAKKAGVSSLIRFDVQDAVRRAVPEGPGILVCNPPYGERMMELRQARDLYRRMGVRFSALRDWKQYILCSDEEFEDFYASRATKKRKLYNGMIRCNYYMYYEGRKK